jgi:hypothetical protein
MALVNPNIAMSFRQPEFRPRNALAEYAQVQQIVGGQRQTEIADMQMEDLRRERGVLGQIAAAISAKGGPDLRTASLLMMQNPRTSEQGYNIYQALQKQQLLDEYERRYGGGAGAPTTPTSAAGAITGAAPAAAEPVKSTDFDMRSHVEEKGTPESPFIEVMPYESSPTSTQRRAQGKSQAELRGMLQSESESGRPLVRYVNPMDSASGRVFSYSMPTTTNPFLAEPLPPFEPTNEPAPVAAVQTNALAPTAPPANLNQLAAAGGAAPDIDALMRRYNLASKAGSPDAAVLLKQIDAALRGDQNKPITVSRGQVVIDPRTGRQIFAAPEAAASLSDRFVPVGRLVFDRQTEQFISPTQAQLAQSQENAATAAAAPAPARAAGKPPVGYRFTPTGDLEPIPGGPAARAAEGSAAAQPKPLTPVQEAARRDKLGKEFKSATAALQTTQEVLDSISFVRAEPGLSRATGFTGMLPSIPEGAAAAAETRLANLKGKITALGKAAAAASGAIGSIANQEWKILSDQIAAIDPVKGTGPLLKQLELVEAQAQGAMARIRDAYQRQFGEDFARFPQFSDLPAPQSSFKPATPANRRAAPGAAPASSGVDTNNPLLR